MQVGRLPKSHPLTKKASEDKKPKKSTKKEKSVSTDEIKES